MKKHDYKTPDECPCDGSAGCMICDGGLSLCKVCGGLEGALTTECCGERISGDDIDRIYAGEIDYRDGAWVEGVASCHSPAAFRVTE